MSTEDEVVKVRIELDSDGAFCALDANDTLIAQHEDFSELTAEIDEIVKMAYGRRARPVLVVGGRPPNGPL
jgi:hypothetical protein